MGVFEHYWSDIYEQVCDVILEPGGLQLGLLTTDQFYALASEILIDFYTKTEIVKKVFNIRMLVGVAVYDEPEHLAEVDTALADQNYLHRSSGYYLDNSDPMWPSQFNAPTMFREDELPIRQLQLAPSPNVEGGSIAFTNEGFGIISATSDPIDFDLRVFGTLGDTVTWDEVPTTWDDTPGTFDHPDGTVSNGAFGVISSFTGNPYLETTNPGFGVIGAMTPSQGNITAVADITPTDLSFILMLPPSFQVYLKYGILARVFSSDNELKDTQKAAYCQARYAEGVNLASAILCGDYQEAAAAA